jgi:hypothetical protein
MNNNHPELDFVFFDNSPMPYFFLIQDDPFAKDNIFLIYQKMTHLMTHNDHYHIRARIKMSHNLWVIKMIFEFIWKKGLKNTELGRDLIYSLNRKLDKWPEVTRGINRKWINKQLRVIKSNQASIYLTVREYRGSREISTNQSLAGFPRNVPCIFEILIALISLI